MAEVVAVWSGLPTSLTPGLEVSLRATSYAEVQREGRSVLFESDYEPLLDHLLTEEGIRSWITTPLFVGQEIRGLLSFSSWRTGAFTEEDRALFDHVGLAVQQTLVPLLTP
jgi:GAF domain-containing protein